MAFRKIRETIETFKVAHPSREEVLKKYEQELQARAEGQKPAATSVDPVVQLVVTIALVLPLSILFTNLFGAAVHTETRISGIVIAILLTYALDSARNKIGRALFEILPMHKLNPYFGSKLEETIQSFLSPRKINDSGQRKTVARQG